LEVTSLKAHICHYFRILHSAADQTMTNALEAQDLTAAQGQILVYLAFRPEAPCARDIEEAFRLSHPTVSGLLARLEKKNFIEFRPDEWDRRIKRITLLPKGRDVLHTMHSTLESTDRLLLQDFTEEEIVQFTAFLSRAAHNIGAGCCKRKSKEEQTL
jgi:MarR family multiple gene transcriptional regulator MgrA